MSYLLDGPKWGNPAYGTPGGVITWSFAEYNWGGYEFDAVITEPAYRQAIRDALDLWQSVADLDFLEIYDSAETMMRFGWDYIDGAYGTVGEAYRQSWSNDGYNYSITNAEVRFHTAENWSVSGGSGTNFFAVAVHEIGHALGLGHVHDENQIMNPMLTDLATLGPGDIAGITTLYGSAHDSGPAATNGDDVFSLTAGNDVIDGLDGLDTAIMNGHSSGFDVTRSGDTLFVSGAGSDMLTDIERLVFTDGTLAFDLDGNAGQTYRIYQAAFDRTPDAGGLSYWIRSMDAGTSLAEVAAGFTGSSEFTARYAGSSNAEFVAELYRNVLGREGEAAGMSFWTDALDDGRSQAWVLQGFSEGPENVDRVSPAISDGIWFA